MRLEGDETVQRRHRHFEYRVDGVAQGVEIAREEKPHESADANELQRQVTPEAQPHAGLPACSGRRWVRQDGAAVLAGGFAIIGFVACSPAGPFKWPARIAVHPVAPTPDIENS